MCVLWPVLRTAALSSLSVWLLSCGSSPLIDKTSWSDRLAVHKGAAADPSSPQVAHATEKSVAPRFLPTFAVGNDMLAADRLDLPQDIEADRDRGTLNLVKVPLAEAAKVILGDILGLNYSFDPRVEAEITLQTTEPITKSQLMARFQSILRSHGIVIVERMGFYHIVPASEVGRLGVSLANPSNASPGIRSEMVSLRFISAEAIRPIIEPLAAEGAVQGVDVSRNALIVTGTSEELASIRETISIFDVDWMKGMSFALLPVKTSSPQAIADELDVIFATHDGPLKNVVRFVPNNRLHSILVITSRSRYLKEAAQWIARLDRAAGRTEPRLHVYNVQNRPASELAQILQMAFTRSGHDRSSVKRTVAPKLNPVELENGETNSAPVAEPVALVPQTDFQLEEEVRIVADDPNNAVIIIATPSQYDRMREVLDEVDSLPNQVMLEATIAEITLNDELTFGMQWYFGNAQSRGTFTDVAAGSIVSSFPGFSYFFSGVPDVKVVLNALSSLTKVNVLSSPTLMVLDNRTATLQVGDQVPVITQRANGVNSPDAPMVNTIEMKDTGVILTVTPRVNDSGRVTLEVKQEVSDVIETTSSGIDSPTIRQRKVTTTVAVNDGETLALGGLIQERNSTAKTKMPLLADIPLLGAAFRSKRSAAERTELVIFIRPKVTRNLGEARRVTREFREQMSIRRPALGHEGTQMQRDLNRIVQ
jgi:general secretion pathway protein D